jgi:hypothetical protein
MHNLEFGKEVINAKKRNKDKINEDYIIHNEKYLGNKRGADSTLQNKGIKF